MHSAVAFTLAGVGLLFSLFFGLAACDIFNVPRPANKAKKFYLFWFNFTGSLVGWIAAWLLMARICGALGSASDVELKVGDFLLALVAFAGVTGHIPMSTMGLFVGLQDLAKSLLTKLIDGENADKSKPGNAA